MNAVDVVTQYENVSANLYWLGDACKEYIMHSESNDDITAVAYSYIDTVCLCLESTAESIHEAINITETLKINKQ